MIRFWLPVLAIVTLSTSVEAGPIAGLTTVSEILVRTDGKVIVRFAANNPSPPSCAGANTNDFKSWYAFDSTTPGGKSILSTLTAAKLASRQLSIWSTSTCTFLPPNGADQMGIEDLFFIRMQ